MKDKGYSKSILQIENKNVSNCMPKIIQVVIIIYGSPIRNPKHEPIIAINANTIETDKNILLLFNSLLFTYVITLKNMASMTPLKPKSAVEDIKIPIINPFSYISSDLLKGVYQKKIRQLAH